MECPEVDVAVIGAGLSGLAFARFYLDTHPESRLTILEKDRCIGGSPLRMTSFSDVALEIPSDAPRLHDTFEAKYVAKYLEDYVDSRLYNGTSLRSRIRLKSEVTSVQKSGSGWLLQVDGTLPQSLRCAKLAVASGLTSSPILPKLPRGQDWKVPILHHRDFGVHSKAILAASSPYENITILGGGKSAADMVYASIKAEKNVNWIIRRTGEGSGIFMNPATSGRYKNHAEAGATQNATVLNPSGFHLLPEWARMLHKSVSEREDLESKLFAADRRYKAWANYRGREGALPGFCELEPTASFFWVNGPVGMIQQDDFWDLVSQKVNVYRSDLSATTSKSIILDDGREVPTDTLFCGTGWDTTYPFFSTKQAFDLGLPHDPHKESEEERQSWNDLMTAADQQILKEFPILASPPPNSKPIGDTELTPARLYRGIASLTDSSILFLGRARMSNNFRGADAQAIWATAYWDGHVVLPPSKEARAEVAYMNAFSRRRYPTRGVDGINFHTDLLWYTDTLVCEAGLTSHRKGWWEDYDEPCLASDFRDCKEEYIAKYWPERRA